MAVIKVGSLIADIRGKVGTNVFSRCQGGAIVRDVGSWVQPDNAAQGDVRDTIEALSKAWSSTLTEAQRESWRTYAHVNPRPNRWGTLTLTNGYAAFIRHNFHSYLDLSALQFASAPTSYGLHPPIVTVKVQQNGALSVTGSVTPDCTGTYVPGGQYNSHPYWERADNAYHIWHHATGNWYWLSAVLGVTGANYWSATYPVAASWNDGGGSTGHPASAWSYSASLAKITTPPANYVPPPAGLNLYMYSGIPLNEGRSYYSGPFLYWTHLAAAIAAVAATTWLRWTWPTRSVEPPWTWPADGSGTARGYALAQDTVTGSISTKHFFIPTFGSLTPW